MVAREVCVNYYNFNPTSVQHASILVKNTGTQVKKVNVKISIKNLFGAGAGAGAEARAGAGAERNICGSGVGAGAERNSFGSAALLAGKNHRCKIILIPL
jgi:hypothetical protein